MRARLTIRNACGCLCGTCRQGALSLQPKAHAAWAHRRWLIRSAASSPAAASAALAAEAAVCRTAAVRCPLNYAAWQHRFWAATWEGCCQEPQDAVGSASASSAAARGAGNGASGSSSAGLRVFAELAATAPEAARSGRDCCLAHFRCALLRHLASAVGVGGDDAAFRAALAGEALAVLQAAERAQHACSEPHWARRRALLAVWLRSSPACGAAWAADARARWGAEGVAGAAIAAPEGLPPGRSHAQQQQQQEEEQQQQQQQQQAQQRQLAQQQQQQQQQRQRQQRLSHHEWLAEKVAKQAQPEQAQQRASEPWEPAVWGDADWARLWPLSAELLHGGGSAAGDAVPSAERTANSSRIASDGGEVEQLERERRLAAAHAAWAMQAALSAVAERHGAQLTTTAAEARRLFKGAEHERRRTYEAMAGAWGHGGGAAAAMEAAAGGTAQGLLLAAGWGGEAAAAEE